MFIVDSPIKCASFYVERIDLASKLRKCKPKWRWSRHFQAKSPLTNVQTLTHQITLFADLHTLSILFITKPKNNLLRHFSLYFILYELPLIQSL